MVKGEDETVCGIAGVISYRTMLRDKERYFTQMQNSIIRRDPDQKGMYLSEHAALLHTRLAVIDPENGIQPMQFFYRMSCTPSFTTANCTI